jgi:hypothetical protein
MNVRIGRWFCCDFGKKLKHKFVKIKGRDPMVSRRKTKPVHG